MIVTPLLSGGLMGFTVGANDSANVFGTAVASRIVSFRTAVLLCSTLVMLGAWMQGTQGMYTYRDLAAHGVDTLWVTSLAAALSVLAMTIRGVPVSASQSMVGAITGIGLATYSVNWDGLVKIVICWAAAPVGAMLIAIGVNLLLRVFLKRVPMSILTRDELIWFGLILAGCYGSYALGANSAANAFGIYAGQFEHLGISDRQLALLGGVSISLGSITFSRRVMDTVGSKILRLDGFTSLVSVISMAVTVHIFAFVGVPVSTSHAVVGAIIGNSVVSSGTELQLGQLKRIGVAWLVSPSLALVLASAGHAIFVSAP